MVTQNSHRRALLLDRDGVVNVDHRYVHRIDAFTFVDGIIELCRHFRYEGYRIVVVTNQSGIARGYYTDADFAVLTAWMMHRFAVQGIVIEAVYYCPHHPRQGRGIWLQVCDCRKPQPGMLLRAARELGLDLQASVLIGDSERDIEAAARAGVGRRYRITGGGGGDCRGADGYSSVAQLLAHLKGPGGRIRPWP